MTILDTINSPADIKRLDTGQLGQLCSEIREYMVKCCAENPGHLASSLGSVELIVGLHYVYDTPKDKIVFDVGHQAYAHKIITGRREEFAQMRTADGISGFPRIAESKFDAFGAGHSSTSISAALGMAEAAKLQGNGSHSIAFIGDGALTGGLAFEGLNNAGNSGTDLLVIVNDNNQSIDRNIGGLHNHLLKITTSKRYTALKASVWNRLGSGRMRTGIQRWWRSLKSWAVKKSGGDLFESLGMRYFGPIDGNNIADVVSALQRIKAVGGPRVLHAITIKGKGYAPAEADPTTWHAPGRFNPVTGQRIRGEYTSDRYQDVFGQTLLDLAREDRRVVGITPAMASGCGMTAFAREMPDRFFDVGIEEEHAVTFSAGLAASGMRPFCNIYSAFSQRAYDQIIHDVALQDLPVVLCLDRAGLVGEDGPTHHGAFDLAAYRNIPGTIIAAPRDETELRQIMFTSLHCEHGPFIIRYPRGCGEGTPWKDSAWEERPVGKGEILHASDSHLAVLALGPMAYRALEAVEMLRQRDGADAEVYDVRYLKPLDEQTIAGLIGRHDMILTVEDGALKGGLYGAVCELVSSNDMRGVQIQGVGLPDRFITQGSRTMEMRDCGLDTESLYRKMSGMYKKHTQKD